MESAKLKSLVHKLVQLKNDTDHMKGFLFKDGSDYFIKPIEVYAGSAKEGSKFYLDDEHEPFVAFCESPKLMKVSMKSWHYRLMKWVLQSNVPTPKTMQNGCPYFWLLVFCLLVTPFKLVGLGLLGFLGAFPALFFYTLEVVANLWIRFVPEERALTIEDNKGWRGYSKKDVPIIARKHMERKHLNFMDTYLKIKYGIDKNKDPNAYAKKIADLEELKKKAEQARAEARAEYAKIEEEKRKKKEAQEQLMWKKHQERKRRQQQFWAPFNRRMAKIGDGIASAMTFDYKKSPIIKRTKQFIGGIVSLLVLCFTVFVVMGVTFLLVNLVDGIAWLFMNHGVQILYGLGALGAIAILAGLVYLAFNWIQTMVGRIKMGKLSWYMKAIMWGIIYPLKYIIMFLYYTMYYVLWTPIKFIFYRMLWQLILVNIGMFLWGILRAFGGILIGSIGIFGEYFGASKKDYCPGIEWCDTDED